MAFSPKQHRTRTYSTTAEELLKATNQVHILMGHHRNYMIDQRSKPPRRSSIPTILEILPSTSFLHDVEPSVIENISVRRTYHDLLVVENTQPLKRVRSLPSLKHANAQLKIQQQQQRPPRSLGRTRAHSRSCPKLDVLARAPPSPIATETMEDVQRRRLSLVLQKELKPVNAMYKNKQTFRKKKWLTLLCIHQSTTCITTKVEQEKAALVLTKWIHARSRRKMWKRMTTLKVVRGLQRLRVFARQRSEKNATHIVTAFAVSAHKINNFRKVISKFRWCVIRIQRCWRTYLCVTKQRVLSMETFWALVERHYRIELLAVLQRLKKKQGCHGGGRMQTNRRLKNLHKSRGTNGSILKKVARLNDRLTKKLNTPLIGISTTPIPSFNRIVPRHWTQFNTPPPKIVIDVNVRHHYCEQLLAMARLEFKESAPIKQSKSTGVFQEVTLEGMKNFLSQVTEVEAKDDTKALLNVVPPINRNDVGTHRTVRYFTHSLRTTHGYMLKLMKQIIIHNGVDAPNAGGRGADQQKKSLKKLRNLFMREVLRK